ncbi:MAG: hypothetical protein KJ880_00625 [Candidatus Omnitrophica bacterium]|nr:hypothetical protein [Candidatus Omnitrophota bacterium]MBU1869581.1 hypothetical protein [Candidatus Omnitrophota bacterium]
MKQKAKTQINIFILCAGLIFSCTISTALAKDEVREPIIVNGDMVEYSMDSRIVTAEGNVVVNYKDAKLYCQKFTVDTTTKQGKAEGDAKLDDSKGGVIEGAEIIYNFETKTGTIIESGFMSNPYFGKAKKIERINDNEFVAEQGYMSTCSYDNPHFRFGAEKIDIFPKDKVQIKKVKLFLWNVPVLYLPHFNRSLKDAQTKFQFSPGKTKDWGPYLLTGYRYNLSENVNARLYLDYRQKLGLAEGFGVNYNDVGFGKGDFKFYYTNEAPSKLPDGSPKRFDRYLARWRHKWDIDPRTTFITEFYKIGDERRKQIEPTRNFLKDYFYREFEKDSEPLSYALFHHNFTYSMMDVLVQKRVNHWYDQLDKLPEVKYTLPSKKIGSTPFYFESLNNFDAFTKKAITEPVSNDDITTTRLDTTNKLTLPTKASIFRVAPFVASRQTFYDRGENKSDPSHPIRTIFYSGVDISTKFYRTLSDIKAKILGMDLNGLRHIITPTAGYTYNHTPTIGSDKLKQIDPVDALGPNNSVEFGLSNKIQTKRNGSSVDLLDLFVSTNYIFKPKTGPKLGSNLSDILFKWKLLPYSWLRIEGDATYYRTDPSNENYNHFSDINYDFSFDLGKERSLGFGQRYARKGPNSFTCGFNWRLNPKWKLSTFHRYNVGNNSEIARGLAEQQYTVERDLHCWVMDVTLNTKKNEGSSIWCIFRLKAFPELEFGFNQSYHSPSSGSQSNP